MLPTGEEADNMEQSTLQYVFNLFGKGVTQMLQTSVSQQTIIDELRAQIRALQTQVSNLTSSLDEVEDRIFVRLQNMQPTVYTREGIPIDDALDSINNKLQTFTEKITNSGDLLGKFEADLVNKVDREEFQQAIGDSQHNSDAFTELSNGLAALQKDLQKQRQEAEDANDRLLQSVRIQMESKALKSELQINNNEIDVPYVTHEELEKVIHQIRVLGNGGLAETNSTESIENSAIAEFALSGEGPTEEKIQQAFELLQKKQESLDSKYSNQKAALAAEYDKLVKIAEKQTNNDESNIESMSELTSELEEEEETNEPATVQLCTVSTQVTEIDPNNNTDSTGEETEDSVTHDLNLEYELANGPFESEIKESVPMRNIGLKAYVPKSDEGFVQEETIVSEEVEAVKTKKTKKLKKGKGSHMSSIIEKMKKQKQVIQESGRKGTGKAVDENKIIQRVMDYVVPRIEQLFVSAFSDGTGNGIKLDTNTAKQMVSELGSLGNLRTQVSKLSTKVQLKADRAKVDQDMQVRITKEEFFQYLQSLFPDNQMIAKFAPLQSRSNLPPIGRKSQQSFYSSKDVTQSADFRVTQEKKPSRSPLGLVPSKNSKMLSLNARFMKGADGKYYLRDMGSDAQPSHGTIFGNENQKEVNVDAALDYQPYQVIEADQPNMSQLVSLREQTPCDHTN